MSSLLERLEAPGPKRILALDGGGIRGAITLGFLERIEDLLRKRHNNPDLRLCDYFDLMGGTSTGAIIASGLAIGMSAKEIKELYLELGSQIFGSKTSLFKRLNAKFKIEALEEELTKIFGDMPMSSDGIKTGLCIVTKRADTGSTWPLLNHPKAKYYKYNKDILLRKAVRASTAAPTYFKPEAFDVGQGQIGAFVDGGVSMHNNPAMQLFLLATLKGFPYQWPTGADQLLLVSVGTGRWESRQKVEDVTDNKLWDWATEVINMLMKDAGEMNELFLQYLSQSPTARELDSEIGDLSKDVLGPQASMSYLRYNATLEKDNLTDLGFPEVEPSSLYEMSEAKNSTILASIGSSSAARDVLDEHFPADFDRAEMRKTD
ncbi:MAG: patatin-like phospholipase family protein [Bacteroidota bacterium]